MHTTNTSALRDYNTISPSAKSLVLLKGDTNIPFASQAAKMISSSENSQDNISNKNVYFWKRVVHFEMRYWSIDQLLSRLSITNILELSSGYSFRGLEMIRQKEVCYIDTDLPEVINRKHRLLSDLQKDTHPNLGTLHTTALNVLDENQFSKVVDCFPKGPIIIVNEGLLMYLNKTEKERLCGIIHRILKKRGGYWITADIYLRSTLERVSEQENDSLKDLVEAQRIEENMFESFDVADRFFKTAGFSVVKEAVEDLAKISSLHQLITHSTKTQLEEMQASAKKIQTTWCLQVDNF